MAVHALDIEIHDLGGIGNEEGGKQLSFWDVWWEFFPSVRPFRGLLTAG